MKDLIERQAAIDAINTWDKFGVDERCRIVRWHEGLEPYVHLRDVLTAIVNLPAAQPERKKGQWIERNPQNSDKCRLIECDQCGFSHIVGFNVPYEHWIENRNFCERCGADMRCEDDNIPMEYFESGGI